MEPRIGGLTLDSMVHVDGNVRASHALVRFRSDPWSTMVSQLLSANKDERSEGDISSVSSEENESPDCARTDGRLPQ